jgi:Tfp pilus assembly protein PilN
MINLLPWREELRQKRKKEFGLALLGALLLGGAVTHGLEVDLAAELLCRFSIE